MFVLWMFRFFMMKIRTNKQNVLQCASFLQQLAPFTYKSFFLFVFFTRVFWSLGLYWEADQEESNLVRGESLSQSPVTCWQCGIRPWKGLRPERVEAMQTRARRKVIACRAGRKNSLPLPSRLVRMTSQLICVCSRAETAHCRSKVSAGRWGGNRKQAASATQDECFCQTDGSSGR